MSLISFILKPHWLPRSVTPMHSVTALGGRFLQICRNWLQRLHDPYRPEYHYMRGPGPKYRKKQESTSIRASKPFGR